MYFTEKINYEEIEKLHKKLINYKIPHDFYSHEVGLGGFHLTYPNKENCKCSAILTPFSYGATEGTIEIMGLLTKEEEKYDSVLGHLSADEVFRRIYNDYYNNEVE